MLFKYLAQDKKGKIVSGSLEASNIKSVLEYLTTQNLKPVTVKPLATAESKKGIVIFRETISLTDKVFLMKYLALMLRVGTDLFKAIDILIEDFESGELRRFLLEVRSNLEKGKSFWFSFANHPEHFSPVVINLIKAGETSGNLEYTLTQIAKNMEKERDLYSKIKASLVYPFILLGGSFLMIIFLAVFAIPRLGKMFIDIGGEIPIYTRIVLGVGMFLNRNIFWIVPLLLALPVFLYLFFSKTIRGRQIFSELLDKLPVTRSLVEKMALRRFGNVLSSLIKAGMPIIEAIKITAAAVSHPKYSAALTEISTSLSKGIILGDSFKNTGVFPAVVSNLIAIGEKAGHTEEILETLADFYETEIDTSFKAFIAFLEPALLLFIGLVVGGIALSLIVPIYQLVTRF